MGGSTSIGAPSVSRVRITYVKASAFSVFALPRPAGPPPVSPPARVARGAGPAGGAGWCGVRRRGGGGPPPCVSPPRPPPPPPPPPPPGGRALRVGAWRIR